MQQLASGECLHTVAEGSSVGHSMHIERSCAIACHAKMYRNTCVCVATLCKTKQPADSDVDLTAMITAFITVARSLQRWRGSLCCLWRMRTLLAKAFEARRPVCVRKVAMGGVCCITHAQCARSSPHMSCADARTPMSEYWTVLQALLQQLQ